MVEGVEGRMGVFLGLPLLFLLPGAFSGMGGVGRMISGVAGTIFLEESWACCGGFFGGVTASLGLSCVLNHQVILFFSSVFLPGTAILLCCKEAEKELASLTSTLTRFLEGVLSFPGDSNSGEALDGMTGDIALLTFDERSRLFL